MTSLGVRFGVILFFFWILFSLVLIAGGKEDAAPAAASRCDAALQRCIPRADGAASNPVIALIMGCGCAQARRALCRQIRDEHQALRHVPGPDCGRRAGGAPADWLMELHRIARGN
jgi:hypothetical protein